MEDEGDEVVDGVVLIPHEVVDGVVLIKSNDNRTGYKGVQPTQRGKFQAVYQCKHLGTFETAKEASFVYSKAKAKGAETVKAEVKAEVKAAKADEARAKAEARVKSRVQA